MNNSYKKNVCDRWPCFGSVKLANFITAYFHKMVDNYIYFHIEYDGTSRISYHRAKIRYDNVGFPYIMLGTRMIHIPNNEEVLNENNQM